jgi:hypothetical protein
MKCKCPTETHGHKAGKCNNLATAPDRMCKPCHDKTAKEMHTASQPDNQPPIKSTTAVSARPSAGPCLSYTIPPQLARLVVGSLPRARQELRKRHGGAGVTSTGDALGKKLRGLCQLVIGDGVVVNGAVTTISPSTPSM